jgi:hypothetical protein
LTDLSETRSPFGKTGGMTCPIEVLRRSPRSVDLSRYHYLHSDGRALIQGWRTREVGPGPDASFESFIYLWIAFNSWASCVTGNDADHEWQRALTADPELNDLFDAQLSGGTRTAASARQFAALWPIFRVSKLREQGIDHWSGSYGSRADMTRAYIDAGAREFAPSCYLEHEQIPLDWGHTLSALYRVRCNLFHGEKARNSENDRLVVSAADDTLRAFIDESGLLD